MHPFHIAAREIRGVFRAVTPTHEHLRDRLLVALWTTLAVDVVATVAIYFVEHNAKGSAIKSIGSSLFWVSAQLLTISSQMPNPLTTAGRIIDIGLELWAMVVVTSMAGMFASFFHRRSVERAGPPQASSD